jgi:hypothetical protein
LDKEVRSLVLQIILVELNEGLLKLRTTHSSPNILFS